jgi:lipopolysaccharide transport system ATP-binding protein
MDRKLDDIVAFSELAEFLDTPVKRYSSGMHARLGFSVAAHVDPDILLVDEVLSVGDLAFQRKCLEKMEEFVKKGITIIFISHNLQAVLNLCPRSLLLRKGSVIAEGETGEVVRRYLTDAAAPREGEEKDRPVWIESVTVVDEAGKRKDVFSAGDKASVLIKLRASAPMEGLAVTLDFLNGDNRSVCNTSSGRLGHGGLSMAPGDSKVFRYDVTLHLVDGSFFLKVEVKNYKAGKVYDARFPAASIYVRSDKGVKGMANLYPVFREETVRQDPTDMAIR